MDLFKPIVLGRATSNTVGAANSPLPIPPGSKGVRFFLQYVWLNTASCGGLGTLSASDALDVTVQ